MPKLTLSDVTNLGGNPISAQQVINTNSDRIEAAMEKTLSRDGSTPNQMESDFDMNHYDILNAAEIHGDKLFIDGVQIEGAAAWISGSGVPTDNLGKDGDFYLNKDNGDVFGPKQGTWGVSVANIKGLQGIQGFQGPQGIQGPQGVQGTQGPQGIQGPQGVQGTQGAKGDSFSPDAVGLATDRSLYDGQPAGFSFLDTENGYLYFKKSNTSGDWTSGVPFTTGPQGPVGPQGIQGVAGPQGIQGPQGVQGSDGVGVPAGGSTGQILSKTSNTDYETEWTSLSISNITPAQLASGQEVGFQSKIGVREVLTSDRIYYVRPDGNNSNNGLSDTAGGAFLTISHAKETIYNDVDLNGFTAYVNISPGIYNESISCSGAVVGHSNSVDVGIVFQGTGSSRDDVVIRQGFSAVGGAKIRVLNVKIDPLGGAYSCLRAFGTGSIITAANITFGQTGPVSTSTNDHMAASDGGYIRMGSPYSIEGGALNHYHATEHSMIRIDAQVVNVTGTPNFTGQFAGVASSTLFVIGVDFSGSATGRTYLVHYNGVIRSNKDTRNVFPGDIVGVEFSGGRLDQAPLAVATRGGVDKTITNGGWQFVDGLSPDISIGSEFLTSQSAYLGRGGFVELTGQVTFESFSGANQIIGVAIFKNGVELKSAVDLSVSGRKTLNISIIDQVDTSGAGGDAYQLMARGGDTGTSVVSGASAWTFFMGRQL